MNGTANGLYGGDLPNQINTPWIDFSEQSTIVGWSSFTLRRMLYKRIGDVLFLNVCINGVSNSTSTTFTLPFICKTGASIPFGYTGDNGTFTMGGMGLINSNSNSVICYKTNTTANTSIQIIWTASGTKEINFTGIVNL